MITEHNKIYEQMIMESQMLTNDDLLAASSALGTVVDKVTSGPQWDLRDALADDANDLLNQFDEFARKAQTYTDEYNQNNSKQTSDTSGIQKEIYESNNDGTYDCDEKIQKIINKLVSEEAIAHDFYIACTMAAKGEVAVEFKKMFISTATDELDDHLKALAQWAISNGYSVPFKYKEYKKHAAKNIFKQLDELKPNKDAKYYIDEAIKSENDAISSYEDAMKYDGMPYELHSICMKNYYDEQQHLDDLQTLATAVEANVHLTWY